MAQEILLTAEAYKQKYDELEALRTTGRDEIAERIKEARSFGDLSENSEYDEAKAEQGKLYSKIAEIKDLIENAEIVDNAEIDVAKNAVTLGSVVVVHDLDEDEDVTFTIVGSQEANPREGRISDDAPLGKALHGHQVGETIAVEAPAGVFNFKIVSVKNK